MSNFSKNLKKLRKSKNMSQSELGALVGVTKTGVSYWENEKTIPSLDMAYKLSEIFNVDVSELIKEDKDLVSEIPLMHLTEEEIEDLFKFADKLGIEVSLPDKTNIQYNTITIKMPLRFLNEKSCVLTKNNEDYITTRMVGIPKYWLKGSSENYFLCYPNDDSISDKSLLLFERKAYLKNDQIGAFCLNGKEYIRIYKKLNSGTILLQSANSNYDDIEVTENDDFKIIGALKKTIINH